jgi:hypothetical protein
MHVQKLWRHSMLLVEGWQDLHEHEQQEIKSMTLDYIHLQQEHRVSATMPCLQDSLHSGTRMLPTHLLIASMHAPACNM